MQDVLVQSADDLAVDESQQFAVVASRQVIEALEGYLQVVHVQ